MTWWARDQSHYNLNPDAVLVWKRCVTQQHRSFVAVRAKTTWHPCVSHSSLVSGD